MRTRSPVAPSSFAAVATTVLLAASCATQAPAPSSLGGGPAGGGGASTPTFYADVLPILQDNCQVCHIENGLNLGGMVAPMALRTYADTRRYASRIASAVESGRMPPWHADEQHRGDFINERLLSPRQAATLITWARGGTPEGDPAVAPPERVFTSSETGWSIGEPDLIVQLPEPFLVHDTIEDQYVDFTVTIGEDLLPEDRWVKAVEFRAGSTAVHHILAPPLGGIAPGVGPRVHPEGLGSVLRTGTTVRFNMHYHKHPGPGTGVWDQSQVAIVFYQPGEVIEHVVRGDDLGMFRFRIPPNDPNFSEHVEYTFERDSRIVWMTPHMHLRGKSALYEITYPDGGLDTLLYVPKYDFNWQHTYTLNEPLLVPAGSKVALTLWWDNSAANPHNPDPTREVRWGLPTTEEMGYGFLSFTEVDGGRYIAGQPIPDDLTRGND